MKRLLRRSSWSTLVLASTLVLLPGAAFASGGGGEKDAGAKELGGEIQKEKNIEAEIAFPSGGTIWIDVTVGGDIHVEGWDRENVSMRAEKSGRDSELVTVSLEKQSRGASVLAEIPAHARNRSVSCSVDVFLRVPRESSLEIEIMGGSIEVAELEGTISGRTMGGAIDLEKLTGRVQLTTMGGDISVARSNLDGTVRTMGGDIILEDVSGGLDASTMGGRVSRTGASADSDPRSASSADKVVNISTMGGEIDIKEAPAGVKANTMGGEIHVGSAGQFADVQTMGGDIRIDAIDGWVVAKTMGGDVTVVMVGDPGAGERDVYISSKGGDIDLTVPRGLAMNVDITLAYTRDARKRYEIESDFELDVEETEDWDRSYGTPTKHIYGKGTTGAGTYSIVIDTINGNVRLREGK